MTAQSELVLYHWNGARSVRPAWMFHELEEICSAGNREDFPSMRYELVDPDTFRTSKTEEFLRMNPNGKVPVLVDGDLVMWEGCAICNYLLDMYDYDNVLRPDTRAFRADYHKLSFYSSGTLDNLVAYSSPIQRVMSHPTPLKNEKTMAANREFFRKVAGPILLQQLGSREFMHGDSFTALDVVVGYCVQNFLSSGFLEEEEEEEEEEFSKLADYARRMQKRKAFQKIV